MIILDSDPSGLDDFQWLDLRYTIKDFKNMRVKNKIPKFTFEGKTGLKIELSITPANHIHVKF